MPYRLSRPRTVLSHIAAFLPILALLAAAGCGGSPTAPAAATCSFTLGSTTTSFSADGGSASVSVTSGSGCAWTAVSGAAFISVTSGATGTANGTVGFTVAANTGAARTGTLTIGGSTITISQSAAATTTPTAATLSAPTAKTPSAGQVVANLLPTLEATNSTSTGSIGTVTYRFEVSELESFPSDARTQTKDAVAQGSGTTTWTVTSSLNAGQLYYWRVRATNGTITTAFSGVAQFITPPGLTPAPTPTPTPTPAPASCTYILSTTNVGVNATGGSSSIVVTPSDAACTWTATSAASFVTVTAGASGTGTGTVTLTIASNPGAARTGTVTIAGQAVTVTQGSPALFVQFRMFDPDSQLSATTECRFRSLTSTATTCRLDSTSFTAGGNVITSYAWTIQYTYVTVKTITGTGSSFSFSDLCGQATSTDDGVVQPMSVQLTITDNLGNVATAISGSAGQPDLRVRLYSCGL